MQRIISREDLRSKIEELLKEFEIIGPKELSNKGIFYQSIVNAEDLYLGEGFSTEPIKKFLLEPCSWILRYSQDNEFSIETPSQPDGKRIIIGARPCEVRGLTLLDKVFDAAYKDSFYINNRNRTIIVGLACTAPDKNCFCTSMEGSPVEARGMDALLFDSPLDFARGREDKFIVEIITERGGDIFSALGEELNEEQKKTWQESKERRKELVKTELKIPNSLEKLFESNYWNEVSQPCLSCGICTYLCPTCHCFDLADEQRKRLRCYDGCSFPEFTLQASGENPRPTKKERYRQRVFHKFDYFKKNFGENLCVGCGRCIRYCPVKINIAEVVNKAPSL